LLTAGLN